MTREEFIQVLDREGYSYEIVGDLIIVTRRGDVNLRSLETIPPGVEFKNEGPVFLRSLETIPPGVEFNNRGNVFLTSLKTISPGVVFKNRGDVKLEALIGGWIGDWTGNIEGIDSKMLLNLMIKRGLFI